KVILLLTHGNNLAGRITIGVSVEPDLVLRIFAHHLQQAVYFVWRLWAHHTGILEEVHIVHHRDVSALQSNKFERHDYIALSIMADGSALRIVVVQIMLNLAVPKYF